MCFVGFWAVNSEDYRYMCSLFEYPPVSGPLSPRAAGEAVRSAMREVPP